MKVKTAWYLHNVESVVVAELEDGRMVQFTLVPSRIVTEKELTPYMGQRPGPQDFPLPGSHLKFFGIELIGPDWEYTLPTSEAASIMGISDSHVRRLIGDGALVARRFGGKMWMVRRAEVEAFTRSNAGKPRHANNN